MASCDGQFWVFRPVMTQQINYTHTDNVGNIVNVYFPLFVFFLGLAGIDIKRCIILQFLELLTTPRMELVSLDQILQTPRDLWQRKMDEPVQDKYGWGEDYMQKPFSLNFLFVKVSLKWIQFLSICASMCEWVNDALFFSRKTCIKMSSFIMFYRLSVIFPEHSYSFAGYVATHGCFDRSRLGYVGPTGGADGPLGNDVAWMASWNLDNKCRQQKNR